MRLQVTVTHRNNFSEFIHVFLFLNKLKYRTAILQSNRHSALPEMLIIFLRSEGSQKALKVRLEYSFHNVEKKITILGGTETNDSQWVRIFFFFLKTHFL